MKQLTRSVDRIQEIDEQQWDRLDTADHPFLSWRFLNALEASGSVAAANGWQPNHLCIFESDRLVAAAPSYIKSHSRGEFVFDWAWADAYHRNPRLLVATDHSQPEVLRERLIQSALSACEASGMSSWHCNFVNTPQDLDAFAESGLLKRRDFQFHWHNRGYSSFDEFLSAMKSKKRKNIRHERRQVAAAGIRFERKSGGELKPDEIHFIHRCYRRTFHAYGNHPALSLPCFEMLVANMPDNILAVIALQDDEPLAMSFYLLGGGVLYGRYWGTVRELPGLHFETAYYQGIEYCIEHGLARFESGAQGEHKIARGFEPVNTCSFHHIRHEGFRAAIADYLEHESEWLDGYRSEVARREPFRAVVKG
jgi:predicted N-acyltransferase